MNKQRRKDINKAIDSLTAIKEHIEALKTLAQPASDEVSSILSDEQDYRSNLPESLSNGQKAEDSDAAISLLEEVENEMTSFVEALDGLDLDDLISKLDDAKGGSA